MTVLLSLESLIFVNGIQNIVITFQSNEFYSYES